MRPTTIMAAVLPLLTLALPMASYAKPATVTTISWNDMVDACGSNNKSGGGHVGCTVACGKYYCDYDCQGTKCTKTVLVAISNGAGLVTAKSAGMLQQSNSLPPPSLSTPVIGGITGIPVKKIVP